MSLMCTTSGRSQWLGAGGWHQDMFIFGAEDGWRDLLFQSRHGESEYKIYQAGENFMFQKIGEKKRY